MAIRKQTTMPGSIEREMIVQLNGLIDNVQAIADKLDSDATVTDTDYGDEVTALKIQDETGNDVTS